MLKRYELGELLGKGASAEVYRATQKDATELPAAVKIFKKGYVEQLSDFTERFNRECKIIAGLNHSAIVRVLAGDCEEGRYYIAMELLNGGGLATRLGIEGARDGKSPERAHGRLAPLRALALLYTLAEVLVYTAERKKIHRDIKPANIMFREEGCWSPVLADFGIAKSTQTEQSLTVNLSLIGSPLYMSPEQILGQKLCAKTDIFSLGVVFYQMIMGRLPFPGAVDGAMTEQIIGAMMSQHEAGVAFETFDAPEFAAEDRDALNLCQSIWSKMLRHSVADRIDAQSLVTMVDQALVAIKGQVDHSATVIRPQPIGGEQGDASGWSDQKARGEGADRSSRNKAENGRGKQSSKQNSDQQSSGQAGNAKQGWLAQVRPKMVGYATAAAAVLALGLGGVIYNEPIKNAISSVFMQENEGFSKAEFDAYMGLYQPNPDIRFNVFKNNFPDSIFLSVVEFADTKSQEILAEIQSKANQGDRLALFQLAEIYSEHPSSPFPVTPDKARALGWSQQAEAKGFFPAKMQALFLEEKAGQVSATAPVFSNRLEAIKADKKCEEGCQNIVRLVQNSLAQSAAR